MAPGAGRVHGTEMAPPPGVRLHRFVLALLRARAQHRGARARNRRSVFSGAWHRVPVGCMAPRWHRHQAFVCIALFWHFFVLVLSIAVLVLVIDALCFQVHGTGCRVTIGSCVLRLQVQGPRAFLVRSMKRACLKLKRLQRMIHRRPEARGGSAGNASLQK